MKKAIMVAVALIAMSSGASQISWVNNTEIYNYSGAGDLVLETYTDYVVRLYKSVDDTVNFGLVSPTLAGVSGDDVWTGYEFNWNSQGADGFGQDTIFNSDSTWGINAGNKIYSVIFNNSSVAGGTGTGYFAIIDDALTTVSYTAGNMPYDAGGVTGGLQGVGGDWQQVVPEPATALLFGIGGLGTWIVRRKKVIG
jgi:hypothetical protein